jgi:tetratricopeptide (TPR) repeat protein
MTRMLREFLDPPLISTYTAMVEIKLSIHLLYPAGTSIIDLGCSLPMLPYKTLFRALTITALLVPCCLAQQDPPAAAPQATELWVLKEMMLQSTPETRLALLEQFRGEFRKAELIPWAYDQICEAFEAAGQPDRALQAADLLLAIDPQAVEIAEKGLKLAERKQDAALVQKWADTADRVARSVLASPQAGEGRTEAARAVLAYTDYLAYSAILQIGDPAAKRERVEEFLHCHKDSAYRSAAEDLYLETFRQGGDARKTLQAAKRILELDDSNVVALTVVAESYLESDNDPKKLVTYATRILALLDRQQKPEGPAGAEWAKKKAALAGRAYWMIGTAAIQQEKFTQADRSLRAALPSLKGDSRMTSAALFYLGWANYRMGKFSDAIRFNKECVSVNGPYRQHAEKNLRVIQAEANSSN